MNAAMRVQGQDAPGQVLDFIRPRLENALRQRKRYRYVHPEVLHEGPYFRVQSPCCSRNVDKDGGLIDIALLAPPEAPCPEHALQPEHLPAPEAGQWRVYARNHRAATWVLQHSSTHLQALLTLMCQDPQRVFWP